MFFFAVHYTNLAHILYVFNIYVQCICMYIYLSMSIYIPDHDHDIFSFKNLPQSENNSHCN